MDFLRKLADIFNGRPSTSPPMQRGNSMSGYSNRPEVADLPTHSEAHRIVRQICEEAVAAGSGWQSKLSDSDRWQGLKNESPDIQIAVMMAALDHKPSGGSSYSGNSWQVQELRKTIVSQITRRNLDFTADHLSTLLTSWANQSYSLEWGFPGKTVLGAVERYSESNTLPSDLRRALENIRRRLLKPQPPGQALNKFALGVSDRIAKLLDPSSVSERSLPVGPFATAFSQKIAEWPQAKRKGWLAFAALAAESGDKSKPSGKWLIAAKPYCDAIGRPPMSEWIGRLLEDTTPDPERPDHSLDILKGFLWASTLLDHAEFAGQIGRFAEKCFRKVPNWGARSVKLGNAALWALSEMAGEPRAAAELFRLREKIKYPSARKLIDNRLSELSIKSGQSVEEMEDQSLPHFGLGQDGTATYDLGDARAVLAVHATDVEQSWFSSTGKAVKSIPADVRKDHAAALAAFRQAAKDIEGARAGQVNRLEQSWVEERNWSVAEWKQNFLSHPLRRPIVQSLIWRVGESAILPRAGALEDVKGKATEYPDDARIALWHPLDGNPSDVLAWRARIMELGITQPIKQAHREIYVLTDAERTTRTYSNRFAAHILRQHQFRALCQARGWSYGLMGGWDGWNVPTRQLPKHRMSVEYQVEIVDDGQDSDSGVSLHLASDQVRFMGADNQPIALEVIAPILFSEVLRDVDLFVAVTSVANDPGWADGGPEGRNAGYWREWAFGELGQSAATRKELVSWIAPKLSIADKLEITEKSLVVQGKRQKYAIHFGSSNIQILPSNRYLCIVPDRAPPETAGLKLPFAGDGLLSTILAKAFMLVDESKIKDETIIRQL